jgi:hypothetical protein
MPATMSSESCQSSFYIPLANVPPLISAKARVNDWLAAQESSHEDHGVAWTILNTGPYMDMLYGTYDTTTASYIYHRY